MDLFGRKAKARIVELERQIDNLMVGTEEAIRIGREQIARADFLVKTLRDQDQLIFQMSQCMYWEQMRPIFAKLSTATLTRMSAESNRIRDVLIPEIHKTYSQPPATTPKAVEHK